MRLLGERHAQHFEQTACACKKPVAVGRNSRYSVDQSAACVEELIFCVQDIKQSSLPQFELSAVCLDYLGTYFRVGLQVGELLAIRSKSFPRHPDLSFQVIPEVGYIRIRPINLRLGLADVGSIRPTPEYVVVQAQRGDTIRFRSRYPANIFVLARTKLNIDLWNIAGP